MELHQTVKAAYSSGDDSGSKTSTLRELQEARRSVEQVLQRLGAETPDVREDSTFQDASTSQEEDINVIDDDEDVSAWA